MDLSILMESVLPQSSLIFKDSGLWTFYRSDEDFINEKEYANQNCSESAGQFIERVVKMLMDEEEENKDPEPLVTIDYAIYGK